MSLINEALKRASDAQSQAAQRPRGPKGVEDLPVPMTPVVARERPAWLPVVGIGLVVVLLLGASGFFFVQWWKERKAYQPYATEDIDENGQPRTNEVAKAVPPKVTPTQTAKVHVTPPPAVTNPPVTVKTNVTSPPEPPKTNLPPVIVVVTNPIVVPPPPQPTNLPPQVILTNAPPPPKPPTPPEPPKIVIPPVTKGLTAEFPELKLHGIVTGKKKTFAVVNGKTLSVGDRVEGVILVRIGTDSVTLEKDGVRREFFLLR